LIGRKRSQKTADSVLKKNHPWGSPYLNDQQKEKENTKKKNGETAHRKGSAFKKILN